MFRAQVERLKLQMEEKDSLIREAFRNICRERDALEALLKENSGGAPILSEGQAVVVAESGAASVPSEGQAVVVAESGAASVPSEGQAVVVAESAVVASTSNASNISCQVQRSLDAKRIAALLTQNRSLRKRIEFYEKGTYNSEIGQREEEQLIIQVLACYGSAGANYLTFNWAFHYVHRRSMNFMIVLKLVGTGAITKHENNNCFFVTDATLYGTKLASLRSTVHEQVVIDDARTVLATCTAKADTFMLISKVLGTFKQDGATIEELEERFRFNYGYAIEHKFVLEMLLTGIITKNEDNRLLASEEYFHFTEEMLMKN